jgi:tRNA pseudouridine38-40 synthase
MPRFALRIAYAGAGFDGWWRQPGRRTVAGCLDAACDRLGESDARAEGASRTDAGVHARDQWAHFDCRRTWKAGELLANLNRHLDADLAVQAVARVADDWNAVSGVRWKTYRYRIDAGPVRFPDLAAVAWRPDWIARMDRGRLEAAAALVQGRHDWAAFSRRGEYRTSTASTVRSCRVLGAGRSLTIAITADAFTYHLARSLVGGLCSVACGAHDLSDWQRALAGTAHGCSRQQAPAHGLHLWRIVHRDPPTWAGAD